MSGYIVIYGVPDDPQNELARQAIQRLTGIRLNEVVCPPSVRDLYRVPFISDESGGRHFGVEGIESFVSKRLDAQSTLQR